MLYPHPVSSLFPRNFIPFDQLLVLRLDDCVNMYVSGIARQCKEQSDIFNLKKLLEKMSGSTVARSLMGARKLSIEIESKVIDNLAFVFYHDGEFDNINREMVFNKYSLYEKHKMNVKNIYVSKQGTHIHLKLDIQFLTH